MKIAAQIADALDAAHDKGIIHRDLKPANTVHGRDEFEDVFELAQAGKPYEVYSRVRFKRVK